MRILSPQVLAVYLVVSGLGSPAVLSGQENGKKLDALQTLRGREYRKVEILQEDPHGITFRHAKGIAKIPFAELTQELREKFNYSEEAARKFLRDHAWAEPGVEGGPVGIPAAKIAVAYQFAPMAYTIYIGPRPITFRGPSLIQARCAARYLPASWIFPVPANAPYDMYLWRQLRLSELLRITGTHRSRTLTGFEDVARRFHAADVFPKVVYESVPTIGVGRRIPAIGAGFDFEE